jgi:RNA polymerase sigma factor (sigma-70 family)
VTHPDGRRLKAGGGCPRREYTTLDFFFPARISPVPATSASLLDRLRHTPDAGAWDRLVRLYEPFIRRWLSDPSLAADADDLTQDVLAILVRELPQFERQRLGSFRAWLRTITINRIREYWRKRHGRPLAEGGTDAGARLAQLADPASGLSRRWDAEHDAHVARKLLDLLEPEFGTPTWAAFRRQVVDGQPAATVAAETGATVNAVLLAKSRVLMRLREEAAGLLEG